MTASRCRSGGHTRTRTSSSRRSRSAWGSTRPTCATSTTSTCRRDSSRTRRRSAAPDATASRRSASSLRAATTCRRSRTSRSATRRPPRRSQACSTTCSHTREGEQFAVSEYELSSRHDVRPLVLKTILTYLELDGFLEQGTPFYAGYSVRPASGRVGRRLCGLRPRPRRLPSTCAGEWQGGAHLDGRRPRRRARRGTRARGQSARLPRAAGLVELKVADVRQRFTLLKQPPSLDELRDRLAERFDRREQSEAERIERVVALVEHDGCQVQSLVGYFGETRADPCGHCSYCLTGSAQSLPDPAATPELELDRAVLDELTAEHPSGARNAPPASPLPLRPLEPRHDEGQALAPCPFRRPGRTALRGCPSPGLSVADRRCSRPSRRPPRGPPRSGGTSSGRSTSRHELPWLAQSSSTPTAPTARRHRRPASSSVPGSTVGLRPFPVPAVEP